MANITLDDSDRAVLAELARGGEGGADAEALAESVARSTAELRERLPELADNGLVRRTEAGYAITASGKQAIAASAEGAVDNQIDTPPDVEREIASLGLRPDREQAVRGAFVFLRYWGKATGSEIVDAVYSEYPAGFASDEEWWAECVRPRLAALPSVESPAFDGRPWRYAGSATVDTDGVDGRAVLDVDGPGESPGSAEDRE